MPSWPAGALAITLESDFQRVDSAADSNLKLPLMSTVAKLAPDTVDVNPPVLGELVPEIALNAGLSYDTALLRVLT
jgi:hypothetical protein